MVWKPTKFEAKVVANFAEQVGKDTCLVGQLLIVISVHKNVLAATVAMQVQVKHDFSFFLESPYQTFCCKILRVELFVCAFPSTIEILPDQAAAIVSIYHSVRVLHRHNFENKAVSEHLGFRTWAY